MDSDPVYRCCSHGTTLSILTSHDEPEEYQLKRAYACLGALAMPFEGWDDHLASTVDRANYYKEMLALPPPSLSPGGSVGSGVCRVHTASRIHHQRMIAWSFLTKLSTSRGDCRKERSSSIFSEPILTNADGQLADGNKSASYTVITHEKIVVISPDCDLLNDFYHRFRLAESNEVPEAV